MRVFVLFLVGVSIAAITAMLLWGGDASQRSGTTVPPRGPATQLLDHRVQTLTGRPIDLRDYRGQVVLMVNTATECAYTSQFETLQALYAKYRRDGLVVLGFPSNDFAEQEPRTDAEIKTFCEANFGVEFPMMRRGSVIGETAQPVFAELATQPGGGPPAWNFTKYLIGRDGILRETFDTATEPMSEEIQAAVVRALGRR